MLDANVANIILLFLEFSNISLIFSSTIDSESDVPGTVALVESLINSLTPFSPILAILCRFAIGPIGVKSNLKSPVITIVPFGECNAIPCESGIEWVVLKNSILKYFVFIVVSSL